MGRRNRARQTRAAQFEEGVLRGGHLLPGEKVSIDQYISALPGRLPHTKGKESKKDRYHGGTIFVDHASQFVHLSNQVSLNAGETIQSKRAFEQMAKTFGQTIRSYRADNVPFGSDDFRNEIERCNQTIDFSGVGAHHQNGVAERAIQTVTTWARTMLLHSIIMWPDQADLALWPFALEHAVYLWNNIPRMDSKLAPIEVFSGQKLPSYDHLQRLHVWGCPIYVLDPKLQDGKKIPKWHPRSRRGQFLGFSREHSSTVGLALNIATGHVSPQFHVVYDDLFTSVPNAENGGLFDIADFDADSWDRLVRTGLERYLDEDGDDRLPSLHDSWLSPAERNLRTLTRHRRRTARRERNDTRQRTDREGEEQGGRNRPVVAVRNRPVDELTQGHDPPTNQQTDENDDDDNYPNDDDGYTLGTDNDDALSLVDDGDINNNNDRDDRTPEPAPIRTKSGRQVKPPKRLIEHCIASAPSRGGGYKSSSQYDFGRKAKDKVSSSMLNRQFLMAMKWNRVLNVLRSSDLHAMNSWMQDHTDPEHDTIEEWHPFALASQMNASDNPTWEEAMNGPDKSGYWKAAEQEIGTLEEKECWEVVEKESWMNVLPGTWAFKCKRFPDGSVRKLKARFCARGDRQIEGLDYFETYAPVTNWMTVRLMLTLSTILGLHTKQVDYTAAFIHAPIDGEVFVEMPRGFSQHGKVLKLRKSIYGLKQSPRNFFQHLKCKLEKAGLESNPDLDPCLFISDKVVCLVYVDDTLFFSPKEEYIDEIIAKLRADEMELEEESSVAGFLGVNMTYDKVRNTVTLTQEGLTKRIIEALNIEHMPKKETPAIHEPLVKDESGDPPDGVYSYSSVIGMLQYLQGHSRPDITYAVSQCARFTHSPKRSHEKGIERIGQYLKGTIKEGLIMTPSENLDIDCYVDADFAGLWPYEDKLDPVCVKSRTGFVLCIADCPIIWLSKLQDTVALSTQEAEYYALSYCMRSVLPLQRLFEGTAKGLGLTKEQKTTFKTSVWEDNQGAHNLANMEPGRITPRSKHYAIKYHWFRSHLKPNRIEVKKIDTKEQKADILTKGLRTEQFRNIRKLLCRW